MRLVKRDHVPQSAMKQYLYIKWPSLRILYIVVILGCVIFLCFVFMVFSFIDTFEEEKIVINGCTTTQAKKYKYQRSLNAK